MLVHNRKAKWALWAVFLALFLPCSPLPLLVVLGASFTTNWSSVLPSGFTTANYQAATRGEALQALTTSLVTALTASLLALVAGTWTALAAAALKKRHRKVIDALFVLPVAVPSVVVGLAILVAYSQPPFLLNGTRWIVIIAHTVLVTAFAHQSVPAAITRLDPAYEQAAAGLCFALSMGELSATMMLYPPDWTPLPVLIYASTDRGALSTGSAIAVALMAATLLVLFAVSGIRTGASYR